MRTFVAGELVLFRRDSPQVLSNSEAPPDPSLINMPPAEPLVGTVLGLLCGYFSFDSFAPYFGENRGLNTAGYGR